LNVELSKVFVGSKAKIWNDFVRGVELNSEEKNVQYRLDECAVNVKRSTWYQALVLLLTALLFVPAIYLLYRPEDTPGVDLVAVILGIAVIRQFFIGSITEWNLYEIDFAFAISVIATALIPLLRLPRKSKQEK
jgi:hypothetical protein